MKHSEKDNNYILDPSPEPKADSAEINYSDPRLRKPDLRLELKLKQRNKKEIRRLDVV